MTSLSGGATRAAAAAIVLSVVLAACGGTSNSGSGSGGSNNNGYSVPQSVQAAPDSPSPLPQAVAPAPSSAPEQQAPAAPARAAVAHPTPLSFQLMPVAGVTGTVTVQVTSSSTFMLTVSASGMAPSSTHAVHIHFGNCPSAGVHIVALASMTANGAGMGTSTTTVHSTYRGDGRFLIVYAGPNPGPLAACAQLAG